MSQDLYLKIPQISDRVVMSKISELKSKFGADHMSTSTLATGEISQPSEKDTNGKYAPPWDKIHDLNSSLIQHSYIRIEAITIAYYRRGRDKSSPIYDEIGVLYNPNVAMDVGKKLEIAAYAERTFKAFDPKRAVVSDPHAIELAAIHESTLTRLESVAGKVIEDTAGAYAQLEQQYLDKRARLEGEFAALQEEQDSEHRVRLSLFETKEAELAARQAAIDDRNNTHARRATRNAMLQDVKDRILNFGVSSNTSDKRKNVARGFAALVFGLFALLAWSIFEATQLHQLRLQALIETVPAAVTKIAPSAVWDKTDLYFVWARISVLTVGLLFSILYYIKWENRWADQHAAAEFQLQQFYIDVNRANWVVESGLEWHKETGSTIPDTIMQSLTVNLFKFQDEAPQPLHPADELASALLGSASKLRLKTGDSELEFDKPGKIKDKA